MQALNEFKNKITVVLTDIDDTLTDHGQLRSQAYQALWKLHQSHVKIIPVTGRPAGWCEMIARVWPVHGIVGENGGFYFRYHNKKMHRHYVFDHATMLQNRHKLDLIQQEVHRLVPHAGIASDQFCRLMDLAIDFCEDVPALSKQEVEQIVAIFERHGAQAKVSSIHVNGWFGNYNKVTQSLHYLKTELGLSESSIQEQCAFIGDSPNDEPMFDFFQNSFAVANIAPFLNQISKKPKFICTQTGGQGFSEFARQILDNNSQK